MQYKKLLIALMCQILIIIFLGVNIVVALTTEQMTMFSYICCHVLAIVQAAEIILTLFETGKGCRR